MMLDAIIIDDEEHARENLRMLLEEFCPSIRIKGTGEDVKTGKAAILEQNPEVIFLDIRMPSGSEGFELLQQVGDRDLMVVFVTAFKDYAIDAFKVNAVDYILKPIDIDELVETVQRLENRAMMHRKDERAAKDYQSNLVELSSKMLERSERIAISHSQGVKLVRVSDIAYLKAESNCTRLVFTDGSQFMDTRTLKVYELELKEHPFYRIHRSYMINLNELEGFYRTDGRQVRLRSGEMLPVAKSAASALLRRMEDL